MGSYKQIIIFYISGINHEVLLTIEGQSTRAPDLINTLAISICPPCDAKNKADVPVWRLH